MTHDLITAVAAGIVLALCTSCGNPRTPSEKASRQVCLAKAELAANARSDEECIEEGFAWEECPAKTSIMDELKEEQEKCR